MFKAVTRVSECALSAVVLSDAIACAWLLLVMALSRAAHSVNSCCSEFEGNVDP